MILSAFFGFAIERLALRPMTGQPLLSIILMTLGLSQVLQGLALLLFGGVQRNFPQIFSAANPYKIITPFVFNDKPIAVILKQNLVWSFVIAILGVIVIGAFFRFTRTGLAMRGTSEDHELAQSIGLRIHRIFGISWALAGVVATTGGILLATSSGIHPGRHRWRLAHRSGAGLGCRLASAVDPQRSRDHALCRPHGGPPAAP